MREKKKVTNESGANQYSEVEGQNVQQPSTSQRLAQQHGVDEKTIRRDAEYTRAVDTITQNTTPEVLEPKAQNEPLM